MSGITVGSQTAASIVNVGDGVIVNEINVKIRRLNESAVIPRYATELAADFDLVAVSDVIIAPGDTALVPLGFAVELPPGYEMQIRPRSGVTLKTKLRVANSPGTIDADYRGEVAVIVDNTEPLQERALRYLMPNIPFGVTDCLLTLDGEQYEAESGKFTLGTYHIRKGDRIAQGVISPVYRANFVEVTELSETVRGAGGFGHSGTRTEVSE